MLRTNSPRYPWVPAPRSGSGTGHAGTTLRLALRVNSGGGGVSAGSCHGEARIAREAGDGEGGVVRVLPALHRSSGFPLPDRSRGQAVRERPFPSARLRINSTLRVNSPRYPSVAAVGASSSRLSQGALQVASHVPPVGAAPVDLETMRTLLERLLRSKNVNRHSILRLLRVQAA